MLNALSVGRSAVRGRWSWRRTVQAALVSLAVSACSYSVHEVYVGSLDPGVKYSEGHWVQAETKDFVILGFEFGTDYVEQARRELEGKCSGRIAQVATEHMTAYWFLSYDQKITVKGLCLSGA